MAALHHENPKGVSPDGVFGEGLSTAPFSEASCLNKHFGPEFVTVTQDPAGQIMATQPETQPSEISAALSRNAVARPSGRASAESE